MAAVISASSILIDEPATKRLRYMGHTNEAEHNNINREMITPLPSSTIPNNSNISLLSSPPAASLISTKSIGGSEMNNVTSMVTTNDDERTVSVSSSCRRRSLDHMDEADDHSNGEDYDNDEEPIMTMLTPLPNCAAPSLLLSPSIERTIETTSKNQQQTKDTSIPLASSSSNLTDVMASGRMSLYDWEIARREVIASCGRDERDTFWLPDVPSPHSVSKTTCPTTCPVVTPTTTTPVATAVPIVTATSRVSAALTRDALIGAVDDNELVTSLITWLSLLDNPRHTPLLFKGGHLNVINHAWLPAAAWIGHVPALRLLLTAYDYIARRLPSFIFSGKRAFPTETLNESSIIGSIAVLTTGGSVPCWGRAHSFTPKQPLQVSSEGAAHKPRIHPICNNTLIDGKQRILWYDRFSLNSNSPMLIDCSYCMC
jgi:hypothetical protein